MGLVNFLLNLFSARPSAPRRRSYLANPPAVRRETVVVLSRPAAKPTPAQILKGQCWVIDGDTIVIDKVHIRLAGIDAPELDHPYGQKAKWTLVQLCKGQLVTAHIKPELSYDRLVAQCFLPDGRDLAAEMVKHGMALVRRHVQASGNGRCAQALVAGSGSPAGMDAASHTELMNLPGTLL